MQKKNGSLSHILPDISEWVSRRWIIPAELHCLFGTGTNHCTFKKIQINSRKVLTCYQNTATSLIQLLRSGSKEKIISKKKADRQQKGALNYSTTFLFTATHSWQRDAEPTCSIHEGSTHCCSLVSASTCMQHTAEYPFL